MSKLVEYLLVDVTTIIFCKVCTILKLSTLNTSMATYLGTLPLELLSTYIQVGKDVIMVWEAFIASIKCKLVLIPRAWYMQGCGFC
jgi:hypothetical protein